MEVNYAADYTDKRFTGYNQNIRDVQCHRRTYIRD